MLGYFLKRILSLVPVLIGITIFAFFIGVASPGDPAYMALTRDGITEPTTEEISEKRHELGLDRPLLIQYVHWLKNASRGDLGLSMYTGEPIASEMIRRLPMTLRLAFVALIFSLIGGIGFGSLSAFFRQKFFSKIILGFCTLLVAVPGFWVAILLISFFSETLHFLPTSGYSGFSSLIMPGLVLSLGTTGIAARLSRAHFIAEINKPYVLNARSKGLSNLFIGLFHIFPNTLVPLVTFYGFYFAGILGGSSVVETIFALPGLGSYVVESLFSRDYFVIQAYVLLTGTLYVLTTLTVDFLYFLINPKMGQEVSSL